MTPELLAKVRALSQDARVVVLDVADHGPGTYAERSRSAQGSASRGYARPARACSGGSDT